MLVMDFYTNNKSMEQLQLECLLSNIRTGVIIVDKSLNVLNINERAKKLLDIETDYLHKSIFEVLAGNEAYTPLCKFVTNGHNKDSFNLNLKDKLYSLQISKDGCFIDGHFEGGLIFINKESLGRKFREMTEGFVASVSHELKTPLTLILGAVETLDEGALGDIEEAKKFVSIIKKHAVRLNTLIGDILSLSSLDQEVSNKDVKFEVVDLTDLLHNLVKVFDRVAIDKGITISVSCTSDIRIRANKVLLEQAVMNLIDNACKYTNKGGMVFVRGEIIENTVHIVVADNGIGVNQKELTKIFERFYRVDKEKSRNMGGTGLGLSIVKQIVKIHDGHITVNSAVGQGTTFTLILPLDSGGVLNRP